jgi:PIN domain
LKKTDYLLIDYENVQPKNLSALNGHPFKVIVFLGANQAKVPVEFASALQALGSNAEYIRISGNGSNALDFHIAFAVGELSKSDPNACFHIISKDSGFDPLIEYLRKRGIVAQRAREIADVPILRKSDTKTVLQKLEAIVRNLASRTSGKPRKVKSLSNAINSLFLKSLGDAELAIASLLKALEKEGHISIEGENVSYHLPDAP